MIVKEYLDVLITGLVALAAGGGTSVFVIRSRRRIANADASTAEIRAANLPAEVNRAELQIVLEVQRESFLAIIEPLREDVRQARLDASAAREDARAARDESARYSQRIDDLEEDLEERRTRYWRAVQHIRDLYSWIHRHAEQISPPPPAPSGDLIADI